MAKMTPAKQRSARQKRALRQKYPSSSQSAAGVPAARHDLMTARKVGKKSEIRKAEKNFLAAVNLSKKRKGKR